MQNKIKEKLAELASQREQLLAQLNAVIGAEQALNQLIADDGEVAENENGKN